MSLPLIVRNEAAKFIEQGHVRVGPDTITDSAYLVTRSVFSGITISCRFTSFQTYGGLCNLGRHLEAQAHNHAVQR
jgi:ribosomal protein S4